MVKNVPGLLLVLFVIAFPLLVAGCAGSNQKTTYDRYAEDGYMGRSTANPSIIGGPSFQTYTKDTDVINNALRDVPFIRKSTVQFRGRVAVIRLNVDPGLTADEVETLRDHAERKLAFNLPRYEVQVKISR